MMFFGGLGLIFMVIFWVVIIALAVWVLGRLFPGVTSASPPQPPVRHRRPNEVPRPNEFGTSFGLGTPSQSALEIAKQRYARGEISKAEYEEIRHDLEA